MSDSDGIADIQSACIECLQGMEAHHTQPQAGSKQLAIGLFDADRVWAISTADVSASSGLVVKWLTVDPKELNEESSTAALRLVHGLHVLAEAIDLPLDLQPLAREDAYAPLDRELLVREGDNPA